MKRILAQIYGLGYSKGDYVGEEYEYGAGMTKEPRDEIETQKEVEYVKTGISG